MGHTTLVEPSPPVIRVAGFHKSYGKIQAVRGIDLEINRGEIYGLIGPDGAGKSSLMKALAGVLTFDTGVVEVLGQKIDSERSAEQIKGRLGLMPQGLGLNLYPELSIQENIDFFARLRLVPEKELAQRKQRLLEMTRLDRFRDRPMKQLSGGMKQKLGLICSLIHEPELVILDEPTTGVDPVSRRDFWGILAELLREQGMTALVSTAYLDEADRFHRVSLLHEGEVLAKGRPDEIRALVPGTLVSFHAEPQLAALSRMKARYPQVLARGPEITVFVEQADRPAALHEVENALKGLRVERADAVAPELEDVFIALLRRLGTGGGEKAGAAKDPDFNQAARPAKDVLAIEADQLVRDFGAFRAVDRVSFRVPQGEIFGLLGANGAGKTTVIKMLTGIIRPSTGAGRVAGADMLQAGQAIKERIGYMSQAFSLYQDLTVLENIRLYAGIYGLSKTETRARTGWIIEMAGLAGFESTLSASLPMGIRQRLALGCALVHRPQVLFLDEPTSGVDPVGRRRLWETIFRLSREEGVTILVTTHYMSEAEHCDHLALMFAGRVVADASPSEMKQQVEIEAGRLLELETGQPLQALQALLQNGFPGAAVYGKTIHLLSRNPEADAAQIHAILTAAGIGLDSAVPRPLSMEDVFVYRVMALEQLQRQEDGKVTL
ncbi:MAG: ATP-binding cassette domain-containing protein [Desulfuromonadaceae bacterium]|nr:ATP-binding cassette domain-containing protein [Desulfuromonadaceae bacterium]